MSNERKETIADIVAWLRRPREGENAYLTLWRDRGSKGSRQQR